MLEERKQLLKKYIIACIFDSKLSWGDLASLAVIEKLVKVFSQDARAVITELRKDGAPVATQMAETAINRLVSLGAKKFESLLSGRKK